MTDSDPVVIEYTLGQALDDGVLIDITDFAREWFRKVPVFMTRALWDRYIVAPEGVRTFFETEKTRLIDVMNALHDAIWSNRHTSEDVLLFEPGLRMQPKPAEKEAAPMKAVATIGPDGKCASITIMLPDED